MPNRAFLFSIIGLTSLVILTSPPLVGPILRPVPSPTATPTATPPSPTATATLDPFANVPTATPPSNRPSGVVSSLPRPASEALPPPFTPTPALVLSPPWPPVPSDPPSGSPPLLDEWQPARLHIPALNDLDVSIEPIDLIPSEPGSGLSEPELPPAGTVGWLVTSAAADRPGNTILVDGHNLLSDLATVEAGAEIRLHCGRQRFRFIISQTLTLPDQDQPLQAHLAHADPLQPSPDKRLTLISSTTDGEKIIVVVATASP